MSIFVFDSGIGGLSIYDEVRQLMPDMHYIYACDNGGFPYGNKSNKVIQTRVIAFMDCIKQCYHIDLAIIACNTVSTTALSLLRQRYTFPIVGVVPAIKPAVAVSRSGQIGLLATKATLSNSYTVQLIKQFAKNCHIECLGLTELAVLAEKKVHDDAINMKELTALMAPWLNLPMPLDTIILGCTHYPFIKEELKQLFPDVIFVDSGQAVAKRVAFLCQEMSLLLQKKNRQKNVAISTCLNNKIKQLIVVFNAYGFPVHETISFDAVQTFSI